MYATSWGIAITTLGLQYTLVTAFIIQTTDVNPTTVQIFAQVRRWGHGGGRVLRGPWGPGRPGEGLRGGRARLGGGRRRRGRGILRRRRTTGKRHLWKKLTQKINLNFIRNFFLFLFLFIQKLFLTCLKTDNSLNPSFWSFFSQMIGHFFKLNLKRHNFLLKNKNFINI